MNIDLFPSITIGLFRRCLRQGLIKRYKLSRRSSIPSTISSTNWQRFSLSKQFGRNLDALWEVLSLRTSNDPLRSSGVTLRFQEPRWAKISKKSQEFSTKWKTSATTLSWSWTRNPLSFALLPWSLFESLLKFVPDSCYNDLTLHLILNRRFS